MSSPPDKTELLAAAQAEARRMQALGPVTFTIGLLDLQCFIAAVQLAMRHPHYPQTAKRIVGDITRQMIASLFTNFPATRALMQRGFDQR